MLRINDVAQIWLGIQGENLARNIEIDVSDWVEDFPDAGFSVWMKAPGGTVPQATGASYDTEDQKIVWSPSSTDTYVAGEGEAEIRLSEGNAVKKTKKIRVGISGSVTGGGSALGADWQAYINEADRIRGLAVAAQLAAEQAQSMAETAAEETEGAADMASQSATAAAGSASAAASSASAATTKADEASQSATAAAGSASAAASSATAASNSKDTAVSAKTAAETAASNATGAATAAETAQGEAENAQAAAEQAQAAAEQAAQDAQETVQDVVDDISDLKSAFNTLETILFPKASTAELWEQGGLRSTDGSETDNITRIRTSGYLSDNVYGVSVDTGYKYFLLAYDDSDNYVGSWNGTEYKKETASWITGYTLIRSKDIYKIRVVAAKTNDAGITTTNATNVKFHLYADESLTEQYKAADAKTVGEKISPLYDDVLIPIDTTAVNGYWANGTFYSSTDAVGKKASVDGVSTVVLTGIFSLYYDYYDFLDASNNVIQYLRKTSSPGDAETKRVDVPTGAVYVVTSAQTVALLSGISVSKVENKPISEINSERINVLSGRVDAIEDIIYGVPIAVETSEDHYSINSENGFVNKIVTNGSNNGLFNFDQLELNGSAYKTEIDDITPVYISGDIANENVGYVGANHGYAMMYDYTFNNGHGLTVADIGKIYTAPNGYKYVLVQVPSSTKLVIGFYASNLWYKIRPVLVATTFNFGNGSITADSHGSAPVQLYPSVKNGVVRIVENSTECCKIEETYDIIDIGTGIEAIIANVGNNDNDSFCTLADVGLTVRNLYEFIPNGSVTVYQNLKICKDYIKLRSYGGVQSMAFTTGDYYSVPQTSAKQPIAIPSAGASFGRETWDDQTIPPMLYMQFSGNPSTATKAFATGFIAEGRNALLSSNAGNVSSAKKMYPALVQPVSVFPTGKVFNSVSFRVPFVPSEYSNQIKLISYFKAYGDYYLIIMTDGATNTSVVLPDVLCNRKAQVVMSDGVECDTVEVINSVDVKSTGVGHLVLKLIK